MNWVARSEVRRACEVLIAVDFKSTPIAIALRGCDFIQFDSPDGLRRSAIQTIAAGREPNGTHFVNFEPQCASMRAGFAGELLAFQPAR